MMRISTWTSAPALCAVMLGTASARPTRPPALPSGRALLTRIVLNEGRLRFRAEQAVQFGAAGAQPAILTREMHLGDGRSRVEYLQPARVAGRLVVTDGRSRWEYNPPQRLVIQSPQHSRALSPAAASALADRICRSYSLRVERAPVTLNGRSALVLHIDPIRPDRHGRIWWVDRSTALVLRREVRDPDGGAHSTSWFTSLDLHPATSPADVTFTVPSGARLVRRPEPHIATDLAAARRMAPSWSRVPATLGDGFDFQSARLVTTRGAGGLYLSYSDGLSSVSLVQVPGQAVPRADGRTSRAVRVGGRHATLQRVHSVHVLSWRLLGTTLNLVADMAQDSLVRMAQGLH